MKDDAYKMLGGYKCFNPYNLDHPDWCNNPECLQIDHVNGGGIKDRYSGTALFKHVLENPKDYQILCANCNWIKRYRNKEGPH